MRFFVIEHRNFGKRECFVLIPRSCLPLDKEYRQLMCCSNVGDEKRTTLLALWWKGLRQILLQFLPIIKKREKGNKICTFPTDRKDLFICIYGCMNFIFTCLHRDR